MKAQSQDCKVDWVVVNSHPRFRVDSAAGTENLMGDSTEKNCLLFFKGGTQKQTRIILPS